MCSVSQAISTLCVRLCSLLLQKNVKILPVPIPVFLCHMPGYNTAVDSSWRNCHHSRNLAGHSPAGYNSVHSWTAGHNHL